MFSIIIPTWNNLAYVKTCVNSLKRHSAVEHDIILHINDGRDGTLEWAKSEGLRYSWSDSNIGICLGVNQAAAMAKTDYIMYMNDDMYVLPDWDRVLMEAIPKNPDTPWLLSGTMIEPRFTNNPSVIVSDFGDSVETFREADLLAKYRSLEHRDWSGASWPPTLVHRTWWHVVGGYSMELSPGMASDTDFAMKFWKIGCRHFQGLSQSRIYHFQCKSTLRVTKNDGATQFLAKWGVTQSVFSHQYLRRGTVFDPANLPQEPAMTGWARFKSAAKRRFGRQETPMEFNAWNKP